MGRLIDQVTSETTGVVEGLRMKQQSVRQKENQAQQLRGQVQITHPHACLAQSLLLHVCQVSGYSSMPSVCTSVNL